MFGKLSQFKHFISQAVTTLNSQRPTPPHDHQLEDKLKFLLDYILRNPREDQFRVYHSLQAPEMTLNELLKQIYHSPQADTEQVASILHFFTFLLLNCHNELVLCKLVSDGFVVELTEVYLGSLARESAGGNVEIEEVNSYKIALIKAYVSRINEETIKYMVINQRMRIFENCVSLYEQYMRVEDGQFGVEATCISNCILLIIKYLAAHPQHSPSICYQEGEKGIVYLLVKMVENTHTSILGILNSSDLDEQQFESLKDKILFLVDIVNSIASTTVRAKIISETSKQLADLRGLFKEIVVQHTAQPTQNQQNYIKSLQLIKVLLKLLTIYYDSQALLPLFSESILPLLHKFVTVFTQGCRQIRSQVHSLKTGPQPSQKSVEKVIGHKQRLVCIFCANMEIVAVMLKSGQFLVRRNSSQPREKELKSVIINILVDIMELLVGEEGEAIQEVLCYKSLKCLLLGLMQLTVENQDRLHEYSVVKFHQFVIDRLRRQLKKNELWDYIVLNYEGFLKMIGQNLLNVEDTGPQEYSFCQFHDPSRVKVPLSLDSLLNAIFINECCRNFRFMIVEKTHISSKDIKLQKNYHNNFITPGWDYEPGKQITEPLQQVCVLTHISKGLKIPISIIEDDDCLLFAHSEGVTRSILLNIRFKSIEGFSVEKEVVHIKLKGLQEVLVEAGSKKEREDLKKFKEYLVQKRDRARERELKFIHHYLDLYYLDNFQLIQQIGQAEIQTSPDPSPRTEEEREEREEEKGEEGAMGGSDRGQADGRAGWEGGLGEADEQFVDDG